MSTTRVRAIAEQARRCLHAFEARLKTPDHDKLNTDVSNQFGLFKIWAGNIGVFASTTASADHRLFLLCPNVEDGVLEISLMIHSDSDSGSLTTTMLCPTEAS